MEYTNLIKTEGIKTINGVDVKFTFEHKEGEKPETIEVNSQRIKDNNTETITATYNVETAKWNRIQAFNIPNEQYGPLVTGIEAAVVTIVSSLNPEA